MRTTALASIFAIGVLGSAAALLLAQPATPGSRVGTSRALVILGLPGDQAHEARFRKIGSTWRDWLVGSLGFAPGEIRILSGTAGEPGRADAAATRESITAESEALRVQLTPDDRLWVFVLGHANLDDGHAWLHLPGPDLSDDQFGALFRGLAGREQVFWMTTAASGAFVKSLAAPGRVVIAATEPDGESNETEFPTALAEVVRRPSAGLDRDKDGRVSLLEVAEATVEAVSARFAADKRAPTEHARLDDNGDGLGTELIAPDPRPTNPDGSLASKIVLLNLKPTPPARSENGTKPVVPPGR